MHLHYLEIRLLGQHLRFIRREKEGMVVSFHFFSTTHILLLHIYLSDRLSIARDDLIPAIWLFQLYYKYTYYTRNDILIYVFVTLQS